MAKADAAILEPGNTTLKELEAIWRGRLPVRLARSCKARVEASARIVAKAADGNAPVYGVNTGFGKLAQKRIAPGDTKQLQYNLIVSHCCGVGPPVPASIVRLMMVLKLLSLGRGASGVRWELLELLEDMLARDVIPVVPAQGSVGASGDLAPLAHMAAVMIGEGEARYEGKDLKGEQALERAGLSPISLAAKEGLALINGTQFSCAYALAGLFRAHAIAKSALLSGALSIDAAMASAAPFRSALHELRGHRGQIACAATLRNLIEGSGIRESHRTGDERVQDPYCLRCQPQVMGACMDLLSHAAGTLEIEANAVTDNPLVLADTEDIISGGNFHGEPIAFAADQIALAMAEIGAVAERRIALLVDPALNFNLPPFLTPNPGLNSGFMIAEVTAAALYAENKQRAMPCALDSTPTSANQEDHVSMSAHGARRLLEIADNLEKIIAIELLVAAQGVEFRAPLETSAPLQRAIARLRRAVPRLKDDRPLGPDIAAAAKLVEDGELVALLSDLGFPEL